jgi:hypothetical protein
VSGIIPTQGHDGSTAGISKTVTLHAHQGVATVPTTWDPTSEGWKVVSTIKADGFGRYKSKTFKPSKTLTLVVRYPDDDWYRGAHTSARKIIVKEAQLDAHPGRGPARRGRGGAGQPRPLRVISSSRYS